MAHLVMRYCRNSYHGREKIIPFDKDKDKTIIAGADKYKDDFDIHIFAHGSSKGMSVVIAGKTTQIRTTKQLENFYQITTSIIKTTAKTTV